MMVEFHFIRPLWLFTLLPLIAMAWHLIRQKPALHAWKEVCDSHLLAQLIQTKGHNKRIVSLLFLFTSAAFMIFSLAGPSWSRLPVPVYREVQPRVFVLDMSTSMLDNDLSPDRLSRAKFKLHDLLSRHSTGQFGLVVYTGEPFVVSPLTEDGETIRTLLSSLTPDIMPVEGQRLDSALQQAKTLIQQAGFQHGQILVLTAEPPMNSAIETASALAKDYISVSIMPIQANQSFSPLFKRFAAAGHGEVFHITDNSTALDNWLKANRYNQEYRLRQNNEIPIWRDEGRWFLIPALLFLLPVFRRGWLQRINA